MEPMYLGEIEKQTSGAPGVKSLRGARKGLVPQIYHLFAFKPGANRHLMSYTREVMRGPSPLSAGFRELIAAFTSSKNRCLF